MIFPEILPRPTADAPRPDPCTRALRARPAPTSSAQCRRVGACALAILNLLLPGLLSRAGAQTFSATTTVTASPGGSVHESMLAPGRDTLLHFTPGWVDFYTKTGGLALVSHTPINTFFGMTAGSQSMPGDPVAYSDALRGRFLICAMADTNRAYNPDGSGVTDPNVSLWVSKAGRDPTNPVNWWKYLFTDPGRDYVGIGVSDDKLVVLWNVFPDTRIYVLDRAKAYDSLYVAGEPLVDTVFTIPYSAYKACRNLTPDTTIHLVDVGGNAINYRSITGLGATLSLSPATTVPLVSTPISNVRAYQPDTSAFGTCEPRPLDHAYPLPEVYMRNGNIAIPWTVFRDYGDGTPLVRAVRCVRFQISDRTVVEDFQVGMPGIHYVFPSAVEDARGTLFLGYDRFSPNEFPSSYMMARQGGYQSPEFLVKAGTASYLGCVAGKFACPTGCSGSTGRWGDYTSMVIDEFASGPSLSAGLFAGGWSDGAYGTGNAIGTLVANYGSCTIAGSVQSDDNGLRTPRAGAPVVLKMAGASVDSTTSDTTGAFSFGLLPMGTYRLHLAWPDSVGLLAIAGTGGDSQTPICATDIEIVISGSQTSAGNQFVVRQQPTPRITQLSVSTVRVSDPDYDLVVSGLSFRAYSEVRVDGRSKATTYDPGSGQLTARMLRYDHALSGLHVVTVHTPAAPGNGTSAPVVILALPRYVSSATFPRRVVGCPGGDADRLAATVVLQSDARCCIDAATATAEWTLFADADSLRIWDATRRPFPPFPLFEIDGTGVGTISFDAAKISNCAHVFHSLSVTSGSITRGFELTEIDVRSFDLDTHVHGAVDRFDTDAIAGLLGTSDRCGDFTADGSVNASDLAYFAAHVGHRAQTRRVIGPNGGETYTRTTTSQPTIPIRWDAGIGDSARVTINIVDGTNVQLVAANEMDDGAYDWTSYCSIAASSNKKIEVIHTAGIFRSGDATLGSDRSDGPFTIDGSCSGGGHGCPFLDTRVAGVWQEENSILGRSTTGEMQRDLYRLAHSPDVAADGTVRLRVREDEQERTRLAEAALLVVDRAPDQVSWVQDGRVVLGRRVSVSRVRSAAGEDLTRLFTDPAAGGYEGMPGTILYVELDPGGTAAQGPGTSGGKPGLLIRPSKKEIRAQVGPRLDRAAHDAQVLRQTGIVVERPDGHGGWVEVSHLYPRENAADLAVSAAPELRLVFVGRHRVHDLSWVRADDEAPRVASLAPAAAAHSRLGDVRGRLDAGQGAELTLSPGERIELAFRVPPAVPGQARDYYFAARGVYTSLGPEGVASGDLPGQIELAPARPNPGDQSVSIGFALPEAAAVRISVYDVAGRLVSRPVDGVREAGRHAVTWDLRSRAGSRVPAGLYLYRMEVGRWRQERKLVVN